MFKRYLCLALAIALGACASAAPFQEPIGDFVAATDAAATALQSFDAAAARRFTASGIAGATAEPRRIAPFPDNCRAGSERCVLGLAQMANDPSPRPLNVVTVIPNSTRLMGGVQNYARALDEIASADASADVRAGLRKAINAAAGLATAIGVPAGGALEELSEPLASSVTFLFQQYENRMKLDALRIATAAADPIVRQAMERLTAEVSIGGAGTLARLETQYTLAFDAVDNAARPTEAQVTALVNAAAQFDAFLTLKTANPFAKVADAHGALTRDLMDPETGFADTLAAIDALASEAQNLQRIVTVLDAAGR